MGAQATLQSTTSHLHSRPCCLNKKWVRPDRYKCMVTLSQPSGTKLVVLFCRTARSPSSILKGWSAYFCCGLLPVLLCPQPRLLNVFDQVSWLARTSGSNCPAKGLCCLKTLLVSVTLSWGRHSTFAYGQHSDICRPTWLP